METRRRRTVLPAAPGEPTSRTPLPPALTQVTKEVPPHEAHQVTKSHPGGAAQVPRGACTRRQWTPGPGERAAPTDRGAGTTSGCRGQGKGLRGPGIRERGMEPGAGTWGRGMRSQVQGTGGGNQGDGNRGWGEDGGGCRLRVAGKCGDRGPRGAAGLGRAQGPLPSPLRPRIPDPRRGPGPGAGWAHDGHPPGPSAGR